jgi:hypothetical protein
MGALGTATAPGPIIFVVSSVVIDSDHRRVLLPSHGKDFQTSYDTVDIDLRFDNNQ